MEKFQTSNLKTGESDSRRASQITTSDVNSEAEIRKKMGHGDIFTATWAFFVDFARNSSVHGVRYLGEGRRHWSERIFWVIAILISLGGCSLMIFKIYEKWQTSPVIVSFAEKSTPVWQIPFPAVTICPETKSVKKSLDFSKVYRAMTNMTDLLSFDDLSEEEKRNIEAVAQVCDLHLFRTVDNWKNILNPNEIISVLRNVSVNQNSSALYCKWRNEMEFCDSLFSDIITEEGFCRTFNILDSEELFREEK